MRDVAEGGWLRGGLYLRGDLIAQVACKQRNKDVEKRRTDRQRLTNNSSTQTASAGRGQGNTESEGLG